MQDRGLAVFFQTHIGTALGKAGYAALAAKADRAGIAGPVSGFIDQDDRNPDQYIYKMTQAGLGMPDRDYYLTDTERSSTVRSAYYDHLVNMLKLAGAETDNAQRRADHILKREGHIASAHWTREASSDASKT